MQSFWHVSHDETVDGFTTTPFTDMEAMLVVSLLDWYHWQSEIEAIDIEGTCLNSIFLSHLAITTCMKKNLGG